MLFVQLDIASADLLTPSTIKRSVGNAAPAGKALTTSDRPLGLNGRWSAPPCTTAQCLSSESSLMLIGYSVAPLSSAQKCPSPPHQNCRRQTGLSGLQNMEVIGIHPDVMEHIGGDFA